MFYRQRLKGNKNLHLYHDSHYREIPVQTSKGPLVEEWLEKLYEVFFTQRERHSKVLVLRFDLTFPTFISAGCHSAIDNSVFNAFKRHLRASLDSLGLSHKHSLKYVAAREYDRFVNIPHYHVAIFLNGNAIRSTGSWDMNRDNLYTRIHHAWASALKVQPYQTIGSIHFCDPKHTSSAREVVTKGGSMLLERDELRNYDAVFYACSYLTKEATKNFYDGCQPFLCSRFKKQS
tara:strand:+ start:1575 stop:2273 length:699 start_codon:yes stop_codon:yes gene_type:complete